MIKVRVKDREKIIDWYVNEVLPIVMERTVRHTPTNELEKTIVKSLNDRMFCSVVLGSPIEAVVLRYDWVRQYKATEDFLTIVPDLYYEIKQVKGREKRKLKQNLWGKIIEQNQNDIINNTLKMILPTMKEDERIKRITQTISGFSEFVRVLKKNMENLNEIIEEKFDYNAVLGNSDIRSQLIKQLNIKVCPYCNRQYINPITIEGKTKYLGDIDHILPKSKYAIFQLSFYNMIPACKACNQLFKRYKASYIMNPYFEGFDDDVYLEIRYSSVRELIGQDEPTDFLWRIVDEIGENSIRRDDKNYSKVKDSLGIDKVRRIKNNIKTFNLDEVYKTNSNDFKRILRIKFLYESQLYRDRISDILGGSRSRIAEFDEELLYGVSLDKEKFQDELLAKAIYDIVMAN